MHTPIRMAISTSSTSNTTTTSVGSTATTATLTTSGMPSAVSSSRPRNLLHFSLPFGGEFCFESCPLQPPSIFPISVVLNESAMYFLSSRDLVSHKIIKSIFKVSVFRIAKATQGLFSSRDKKLAIAIPSMISTNKLSILNPSEYR